MLVSSLFLRVSALFLHCFCVVSASSESLILWCLRPAPGLLVAHKSLGGSPVLLRGGWGGWAVAGACLRMPPRLH